MQRKQQIISSIVGVGKTTSQILLAVLLDIDKFPSARHLISWLGLSPVVRQSGKFSGVARLSKMGDKMIRKALICQQRRHVREVNYGVHGLTSR